MFSSVIKRTTVYARTTDCRRPAQNKSIKRPNKVYKFNTHPKRRLANKKCVQKRGFVEAEVDK